MQEGEGVARGHASPIHGGERGAVVPVHTVEPVGERFIFSVHSCGRMMEVPQRCTIGHVAEGKGKNKKSVYYNVQF